MNQPPGNFWRKYYTRPLPAGMEVEVRCQGEESNLTVISRAHILEFLLKCMTRSENHGSGCHFKRGAYTDWEIYGGTRASFRAGAWLEGGCRSCTAGGY